MRGLRRRFRFLAIATLVVWAWQFVTGGSTYRPTVVPVGWNDRGELLFVHQEETGGYDWRSYACGGTGLYALGRRGGPRPVLTGRAWCGDHAGVADATFTLEPGARRLFLAPERGTYDCGAMHTADLARGRWFTFYRTCATDLTDGAVSPDGRWFVARPVCHTLYGGGGTEVLPAGCVEPPDGRMRLFAADGSGARPIGREEYQAPVWSPDGRSLLVIDRNSGTVVRLDLATGGAERVITRGGTAAWSPDGRWIAFTRYDARGGGARTSLGIIRADGTGERTLFVHRHRRTWSIETAGNGAPERPLWSPDGRHIVFARLHNRGHTLWRVSADGTGLRRLSRPIEPGG